jgi:hypothetical protein
VKAALEAPGFEDLQPHFRAYKYMIQENRSRDFWHDPNYAEMRRPSRSRSTPSSPTSSPIRWRR